MTRLCSFRNFVLLEYKTDDEVTSVFNRLGKLKSKNHDLYHDDQKVGEYYTAIDFSEKYIKLSMITIYKEFRGNGYADMFMNQLVDAADELQMRIALTPSNDFGASKSRLTSWYRRYDFVPNSGRNKDFTVRETMIRKPK